MGDAASPPLVWITRAEPGASATAKRVEALGYRALVSPLLEIEPLATPVELSGVGALAFTSANGVRTFAAASAVRELFVYAVGDRTADEARTAGFTKVESASGDVEALAALIAERQPRGVVLHPGTSEPAGDLVSALEEAGLRAKRLVLYRSVDAEPTAALTAWERLAAVLIHSPRAARALERLMAARPAPHLHALTISPAAAEPLKHLDFQSVATAPLPNEAALLNLLVQNTPI
ncbi:MAG: hypothetical protein BGN86_15705 [Caulobacterales bacterium 68-7]|nr:MAG: hypothetical protein BGN86_15705 [Caulobacterales bacterium 68-7]